MLMDYKRTTKQSIKVLQLKIKEYYVEQPLWLKILYMIKKRTKVIDGYTCLSAFTVSGKKMTLFNIHYARNPNN
jgi:hypothetical protein